MFLKRKVLISTGLGVLLACLAALFMPWNEESAARISSKAKNALDNKDFEALATILEKHPTQLGNFRAALSQQLLKEGKGQHAIFASTLIRLQESAPLHARLASISLLVSRGELENALEESLNLETEFKTQIQSKAFIQPGMIARMVNLLKIAELYYALGRSQEEAEAWQKFEQQADWDGENAQYAVNAQKEAMLVLEKGFKEEGIDLKEYVGFRKRLAQEQV